MSKTKEYGSDVQQKIVDHHKIESGCKTITEELKIPILTPFSSSSRTLCCDVHLYMFGII